ncbi:MAG: helix-turn-helix transcriptional regulator [Bacteroidaceae bacterium]|nr:helix-turn-helix transcriptional regulator [Bacteroidaceae bacterium]
MANKELRIKDICKEKGITLETLANKLNIRRTSLAQAMSRNNFSIDKLAEIADALGVEIPDLFQGSLANSGIIGLCPHCGKPIHISIALE